MVEGVGTEVGRGLRLCVAESDGGVTGVTGSGSHSETKRDKWGEKKLPKA